MRIFFLLLLSGVIFYSCNPKDSPEKQLPFFQDPIIQKIYNLQDHRDTDGLKQFLSDENPVYRKLATLAFGSVQDSAAIPALFSVLLKDNDSTIRAAAAYALGQTYDSTAAARLLESLDQETNATVREAILEAIGKCISAKNLSKFNLYHPQNIPEKRGLLRGFYYAGTRNVYDNYSVERAVAYLDLEEPYEARLAAAHFLSRIQDLHADEFLNDFIRAVEIEKAADVRMNIALILGKIKFPESQKKLIELTRDNDYRVQVNAISGLQRYENKEALEILAGLLSHPNHQIAVRASEALKAWDNSALEDWIKDLDTQPYYWRVKRNLQEIFLKITQDPAYAKQLEKEFLNRNNDNPYDKAAILTALGQYLPAYKFIVTHAFLSKNKAISTAGMTAIKNIRESNRFPKELIPEFARIVRAATLSRDLALIGIASELLLNPQLNFKSQYDNYGFLQEAKESMNLPKDNEALQIVEKTIAYFEGRKPVEVKNEFNHPLDWNFIKTLNTEELAIISTSEGDIKIKLFTDESPGSVANFLKLASDNYYDGIYFHRVVPNFVVQAGCYRGDGWGSLDYSIRSELGPRKYTTGSVGMASAGKDTEGTQFFITHSTTMHLDGKYTIFAEVIDGMEVVDKIKMGSQIISVDRLVADSISISK